MHVYNTRGAKICIHILRDVTYVLIFEVEVRSKDGANQMNVSVTMRQAGQSSVQTEYYNFNTVSFLKMCILLAPPVHVGVHEQTCTRRICKGTRAQVLGNWRFELKHF